MRRNSIISIIISSVWMLTVMSCSDTSDIIQPDGEPQPIVVYADVAGIGDQQSRSTITENEDQWSIVSFNLTDRIGIFASGGNFAQDNGPFENQELIYDGSRFIGEDGATFSPTFMNGSETMIYYPYSADVSGDGMLLRTTAEGERAPLRCIDMLTASQLEITATEAGKEIALYGQMDHAFSELIIMRGEGFDNPPPDNDQIQYSRITVVLRDPITRVKIEMSLDPSWSCAPSLVYNSLDMDAEVARRWDAWKGGNFGITEEDQIGKKAWYVIVPTIGSQEGKKKPGNRSYVDYIELYDNDGHLQRVSSLKLSGAKTKYVDAGWRYPMEITMQELVPTVNPFPITPWGEDTNLTDERKRGINNLTEFAAWVRDYNAYILDSNNETKINALLSYGDKYQDPEGKISWHFYVLSDLDLSAYNPLPFVGADGETINPSDGVIIPKLLDILDGRSTTLVDSKFINYKITGLTKTFVGEMGVNQSGQNNGSLQNFDFIEPDLKYDESSTTTKGILANTMNGASVINCNLIRGTLFNPGGAAGMISGTIANGIIRGCTITGFLVCTSTSTVSGSENIIGENPTGSCTFEDNDASDITRNNNF